jgi:uncharacterized membrane protein YphA (DoxX/SURF4 family)
LGRKGARLLFSTFPGGSRGIGLLLLRCAVGLTAIVHGAIELNGSALPAPGTLAIGMTAIVWGACLVAGFLTPVAGALVALGAANIAFSWFPLPAANQFETRLMTLFVGVVAATVVLLGPGGFSVDARLFGRREIIIPRSSHSPES